MGKITGFMEFERIEEGYKPVPERLKNYKEFVIGLSHEQAKTQAARCMDCGTPFCNNGCPVNNIIPDFNDLVYQAATGKTRIDGVAQHQQLPRVHRPHLPRALRGRLRGELQRRRGGHQVDRARHHRPRLGRRLGQAPLPPKSRRARKWPWSAAGPAGLAAAQQLARVGHEVTVFEKNDRVGGLLRYGIPDFKMEKIAHRPPCRADAGRRRGVPNRRAGGRTGPRTARSPTGPKKPSAPNS
jgi:glutamate synthase (NADPH/NADH) small chain